MMKIALQYDQSPPCDLKVVFQVLKEKQKMLKTKKKQKKNDEDVFA